MLTGINVRRSVLVIAICGVLMGDILTGGALQRRVVSFKRYGQAALIGLVGLGLLLLVNRPGSDKMSMVHTASGVIAALPSSAATKVLQGGLGYLGGSSGSRGSGGGGGGMQEGGGGGGWSGGGGRAAAPKRSVSEARKKAVAAGQGWQCGHCAETLEATYEVDHVVELQDGGTNDMSNLAALCRNCHGRKTLNQRLAR